MWYLCYRRRLEARLGGTQELNYCRLSQAFYSCLKKSIFMYTTLQLALNEKGKHSTCACTEGTERPTGNMAWGVLQNTQITPDPLL